jgi:hypothetical protein
MVEATHKREIAGENKRTPLDQGVAPDSGAFGLALVAGFEVAAARESVREGLREAVRVYDFPWSVRLVIRSS